MKFCFQLRPLKDIRPWRPADGNPYLSWFGLTDGWFWIEVDGNELFRYSEEIREHWQRESPDSLPSELPYEDYYVVRPWEDLLEMLPTFLDPLPDDIAAVAGDAAKLDDMVWRAGLLYESSHDDTARDTYWAAAAWWNRRLWNAAHLQHAPGLWIWRVDNDIHVRWDNREVTSDGLLVWEATHGETAVPVIEFLAVVESFHTRFVGEMAARVETIVENEGIPGVSVDLAALVREQADRSTWLTSAVNPWAAEARREYSWDEVRAAIRAVDN